MKKVCNLLVVITAIVLSLYQCFDIKNEYYKGLYSIRTSAQAQSEGDCTDWCYFDSLQICIYDDSTGTGCFGTRKIIV